MYREHSLGRILDRIPRGGRIALQVRHLYGYILRRVPYAYTPYTILGKNVEDPSG
jgi:hypothetical protein